MKNAILLTGATGFLGTELVSSLIHQYELPIYVLVRGESSEEAENRLKAAWNTFPDLYQLIGSWIIPVKGDFTRADLGLSSEDSHMLLEHVSMIFHAGAEVGLQKDEEELLLTNREGTRHMLSFARALHKKGQLTRFLYISTAYVAGQTEGRIMEEDPLVGAFSSLYEKSKAQAEMLVRKAEIPFTICRPGMIVGSSVDGHARTFNTIYYVLKRLLLGDFKVLPVKKNRKLNLVPVDYVASTCVDLAFHPDATGKTFHLTCPKDLQPEAGELVEYVRSWAKEHLGVTLAPVAFTPVPALKQVGLSYNRKKDHRTKSPVTNLLTLLPYFYGNQEFDRSQTDALTGAYTLSWRSYADALLTFACRKNFMHQTGRDLFKQARIRRESKSHPITYYDVTADGLIEYSGQEVNRRIDRIASALWGVGLRSGDKIAMTGINSVDYVCLDQAIGTIGATSVPIYYTTPIDEVKLLLERSGARWFFVGDTRIMEHIEEVPSDVTVVSFSAGSSVVSPNVMKWETFLSNATSPVPVQYPDPDSLATIRYTSGTTGEPKGVMFSYRQLAWMGEVLTNLLPWQERNDTMRYLSFLPLSHVVEGILASYAPYYMLADTKLYYLNDFGSLVDKLPQIRPTVFFSVPRFYEKVWDQLAGNKIGKTYLSMEDGPAKDALAIVLKKVILKKAGLDACSQLIVGSAPVSEKLLMDFRALGIEIHNAYGQTEAPLITINRLGDNIIPTIGTALPETTVTVQPDGELIVTGPQVALGYYGLETDTISNGILKTGDLGSLHENGHITLHGRKKEMIVTSYGKNINIPKIEERLKNIKGVSEAVLIGENRPYCTALLWLEGENPDLDQCIQEMNADLSHPEQIKRYSIIETPLSIGRGELTPNLKVKRVNVEAHYEKEIQEMYT